MSLCLVIALRQWRKRPKAGETPDPPKWMARIDGIGPFAALALGVLLAAVNPKNLLLTVAAATTVGQQPGLSTTDTVITWAIFVVIASLGIAIPVFYRLIRGERGASDARRGQDLAAAAQLGGRGDHLPGDRRQDPRRRSQHRLLRRAARCRRRPVRARS